MSLTEQYNVLTLRYYTSFSIRSHFTKWPYFRDPVKRDMERFYLGPQKNMGSYQSKNPELMPCLLDLPSPDGLSTSPLWLPAAAEGL